MPTITHITDDEAPAIATLFRVYQPIEQYLRLSAVHALRSPTVALTAIDLFLMHLITTYYPAPLSIVDLAADATAGVSTFFWANERRATRVVTACQQNGRTPSDGWRSSFRATAEQLGANATKVTLAERGSKEAPAWEETLVASTLSSPVLVTLAVPEENGAEADAEIARIFDQRPDALLCLLPLGRLGESLTLQASVQFCATHADYRLTALREISPFFASSQLGLICQRTNAHIPDVLERIRQLYEGNFQFLTLVRELTTAVVREEAALAKIHTLETTVAEQDEQLRANAQSDQEQIEREQVVQERREKDAYAVWLESRLRYLEEELLPWKNEYIEQLELHLRNLETSKALKVGHAVRRLTSIAGSLRGK